MNTFQKTCLLLFAAALLTACEREIVPTENGKPSLPALGEEVVPIGSTSETFTCYGYDMVLSLSNGVATITTGPSSTPPQSTDEVIQFSSSASNMGLSGIIFYHTDSIGDSSAYELLSPPQDGRTYWAVPFDEMQPPIKLAEAGQILKNLGVGDCDCESGGECTNKGSLSCWPIGCNACMRDNAPVYVEGTYPIDFDVPCGPVVIVSADCAIINGIAYQ